MQLAEHEMRIRCLAAMATALGSSQDLRAVLETAAEKARGALQASSVSVSKLEDGVPVVRTVINVGDLGPQEVRWPEDESYALADFMNLVMVVDGLRTWTASLDDADGDADEAALLVSLGKSASLGAPIVVDGRLWGELYATRTADQPSFGADDLAYAEASTAILAGAVSRSVQEKALERLAYRDPLTGLLNRRALDEHAARAFAVAPGTSRPVTVVVVDINGLKLVNDTLGHAGGDRLIQLVARTLTSTFSQLPGSQVARVGGDEFTVLVSGHDPARVVEAADALFLRSEEFPDGAEVSCGAAAVVVTTDTTLTPSELFAAADRAQYVAKRGRLNRTVVADRVGSRRPDSAR
jgi:diguanylate cyclase (GGDEF)-like protein